MTIEVQMRHLERLFGELDERGAETFEISERAHEEFRGAHAGTDGRHRVQPRRLRDRAQLLLHQRGRRGDPAADVDRAARKAVERFPITDYEFA